MRVADQVAVRLAVVGGTQFKNELNQAGAEGARAMGQITTGARNLTPVVQNAAFQIGDFAVQVASGTSATRAFAQQAPQLLGSFGLIGAVGGAAIAVFAALAPVLFSTGDAAGEAAAKLVDLEGSIGSVESATAAVRETQQAYNDAINATGGASSAAASVVIASSKAEFEARKEVLEIELQLLKIRGQERAEGLANIQEAIRARADAVFKNDFRVNLDPALGQDAIFAPAADRAATEEEFSRFSRSVERDSLAARKLKLEIDAINKAVESGNELLGSEFATIASGKSEGGASGGGGAAAQNEVLKEAESIFTSTRTAAEAYNAEVAKLNSIYQAGAIDTETYNRALALLKDEFVQTGSFMSSVGSAVKSSLGSLFDGIVEGGTSAGEVLENLAKKLASLALQNSAFQLLAGLAPNIFGAGGSIPLVANAMGNAFRDGRVTAFATGGVVSRPTLFPMRGGMGLMGEAGEEGILPLTRVGGKLGVNAAGAGGGGTVVQIFNSTGAPVREQRSTGPDGRDVVKVIVGEEMARGSFDAAMKGRYGSRADKVRR
jgi:hypothetical protein